MDELKLISDFEQYDQKVRLSNVRIASILVITLVPFGMTLDWLVYPQLFFKFLGLRVGCSVLTALSWLILEFFKDRTFAALFYHAWYFFPSLAIAAMIALSEGAASSYYAGLNLVILAVCAVMQTSLKRSLLAIGIIFSLYVMACLIHGGSPSTALIFNNAYFLVLTSLIVLAGNYNYNRLRFEEFKLRYQLAESEKKLQQSNLQLKELDEAKSRFFANISHELRTPLTLILGPIERLKDLLADKDPACKSLLEMMDLNSNRLLKLINNLLDLIRSESGQDQPRLEAISMDRVIAGMVASVQYLANQRGVRVVSKYDPSPQTILVDDDKLEKIILNLILNSIKFTPAGGLVTVSWKVVVNRLLIEVEDTGIGIEADDLDKIFDRFWQANTSSTRKFQGVGIGLALVKEFVTAMQGEIQVQSTLGKGTLFSISLPVSVQNNEIFNNKKEDIEVLSEKKEDPWLAQIYRRAALLIEPTSSSPVKWDAQSILRSRRPLVLVADDEPDMAQFISAQLETEFEVVIAPDGQYAVDLTRQFHPSLIILDMMMPEKDGLEVCRELKNDIQTKGIPILAVTARVDEEAKQAFLQFGAIDFLTKPFSSMELLTRSRNLVALSTTSTQLSLRNAELVEVLDQLKESEMQMVQHAKIISLGQMSAGLIHEINNPINYVSSAVHLLKRKLTESSTLTPILADTVKDIEEGLRRVSTLISSLRTFSHSSPTQLEVVDLVDILVQAIRLTDQSGSDRIKITTKMVDHLKTWGNPIQLSQVFVNILQNAIDACAEKDQPGELCICGVKKKDQIEISIKDTGHGISPEIMDRILDPFFTTKKVGAGMGLGLSISHSIVRAHRGDIKIQSEPGVGSLFTVILPLAPETNNADDTLKENSHELALRL